MGFQAVKGIAGTRNDAERARVNANSLWYNWDRFKPYKNPNGTVVSGMVPHFARDSDYGISIWTAANIQYAARTSRYLMIGNEWNLYGYSDVQQCRLLRQAITWAKDPVRGNPNVRIVAPNESCYAPKMADYGKPWDYGIDQLSKLDTTYHTLYGKLLSDELWAVGYHHYYEDSFGGWSNFTSILRRAYQYAQAARPGIKIWLTEWGSLNSTWNAFKAMQTMRDWVIPRGCVNSYFYFQAHYNPKTPDHDAWLFKSNGSLTLHGQRYRDTLPPYRG